MKRIRGLLLATLLAVTFTVGPVASTALANPSSPALELVLSASPLAAATVAEPAQVDEAPAVPEPFNIADWFTDTAALAAVVVAVVAFLKTNLLKNLTGMATIIASLVAGAVLGAIGSALGYVEGGIPAGLLFGVTAGFLASGGWDAIGGLLGKRRAAGA